VSTPAAALPLKDIHLPAAPGWWPPAPGWWLLAALLVLAAWLGARAWLRWRAGRRWRRGLQAELERIAADAEVREDPVALTTALSQVLRRAVRLLDPTAAALDGSAWLEFLDRQLPPAQREAAPFARGVGRVLAEAPWRPVGTPDLPTHGAAALIDLVRAWLAAALPRRPQRA